MAEAGRFSGLEITTAETPRQIVTEFTAMADDARRVWVYTLNGRQPDARTVTVGFSEMMSLPQYDNGEVVEWFEQRLNADFHPELKRRLIAHMAVNYWPTANRGRLSARLAV